MQPLKRVFGLFGTLFSVLYCGYLVHYFLHISGSWQEAQNSGLGPTIVGLSIVGAIFLFVFIVQIILTFVAWRSGRSGGGYRTTRHNDDDDDDGFDADAVIARYMARESAEAATNAPSVPPRNGGGSPPKRPGFGRKK